LVSHAFCNKAHDVLFAPREQLEFPIWTSDSGIDSSEKRRARSLLLLARYGRQDHPQKMLPKISQETLAEMIGATRFRINFFMNKSR
jgi:hypothetical protein